MPATPEDIQRAADPDEAARALLWQEQRRALAAKRTQQLALLVGNEEARRANAEAWAPLRRSPGDAEGP